MRPGSVLAIVGFSLLALVALALSIYALPTHLKVAVGPDDRGHAQLMTAFARKLQSDRAPVRLTLLRKADFGATAAALETGEADLAVVRSDRMPRNGQTVAVLNELPVLFIASVSAKLRRVADLAGKRVGVSRGSAENMKLLDVLLNHAGIDPARVSRLPLEPAEAVAALTTRRVDALMLVGPLDGINEHTLQALLRMKPARPLLFGVAEAEAISHRDRALEAIEVPRGALGGTPVTPADDLPTLAATQRLVARSQLAESVASDVTRLLFTGRLALAAEVPSAKALKAPEADTGAALPLHPGAAAYLSGEQKSFFDRYGDLVYIGSMLATMVASGLGALISYLMARQRRNAAQFTHQLLDLLGRARGAPDNAALLKVEKDADDLLALAFKRVSAGAIDSEQFSTFATLNDSVHDAIDRRGQQLRAVEG